MSRFIKLAGLTLCPVVAWASISAADDKAGDSVPPASATPKADPPARPEPPASPRVYLETGARLYNKGRYDLAAKYLKAAHVYRDRLSANEQVVLDIYREKLEGREHQAKLAESPPSPIKIDGSVAHTKAAARSADELMTPRFPAPGVVDLSEPRFPTEDQAASEPPPLDMTQPRIGTRGALPGPGMVRGTDDTKQKARWLLQQAREQMFLGQLDEADATVAQAAAMDVAWTMLDETPKKLSEAIAEARSKGLGRKPGEDPAVKKAALAAVPHDRRNAKALLREARAALVTSRVELAEEIVQELRTWNLRFFPFEDNPEKVAAAIAETRQRESSLDASQAIQSLIGIDPRDPRAAEAARASSVSPAPATDAPR